MKRRHIAVLVVLMVLLVAGVAPSASSAPSPNAALKTSFNTWGTGSQATGFATFERGGAAFFHTATNAAIFDTFNVPGEPNSGIGAVRLAPVPGWPSGPFCDSNVFGIWIVVFDTKETLQAWPDQFLYLDGVLLDSKQTPLKPWFDPSGFVADLVGGDPWWFSFGVPVYGELAPGDYVVSYETSDGSLSLSNQVEVVTCP